MQYVGVFSAVINDQCPKYRGIYRNNDLLDLIRMQILEQ